MKITRTLRATLLALVCMLFFAYSYAQVGNANFTYQAGCNGVVSFAAVNQNYTTYHWTFGDNTTAIGPNPVHDYSAPGNYSVSLTITGPTPDSNVSVTQIYVGQFINQQITGPTSVCSGSSAGYSLTNPSGSLQYNWLASGATLAATAQADSVDFTFPTAGPVVLSVILNNGAGCDSILKQNITVNQTPILVLPGHANDSISGQTRFTICQNTPVWYHVLTNTPGNITWSSPTGVTLSAQGVDSMLFNFPAAGSTTIQIAEVTPGGCTDTVTAVITISANPAITITADNACLGSNTDFSAVSNPPGSPLTYQWIFDDGGQATGPTVAYAFTTAGIHSGEVIATNQNGCVDTASATSIIDIHPGPVVTCVGPVCAGAQEVYSTPVLAGVSYHWTVTGGNVTSGGGISDNTVAVTWGNGQMGTISLFLTGAGTNCSVPTTINVPILGGALAIQGPSNPCYYSYVNYSTEVVPGGVYTWTLSTGSIISGQGTPNIQAYFYGNTPGTVSVNITHQILSCTSSASLAVAPEGQFTVYGPLTVCAGISTAFSASGPGAFNWTVTGGTIVSGNGTPTIYVLFNSAGNYTVTANIATGYCNTTANTNANVVARKQETIIGNALTCQGSNENYAISPNDQAYQWYLGHGGTIIGGTNGNSINVNWAQAGPDTVQVIYSDMNGCPDTSIFAVNVAPQDVPTITGDTLACQGSALSYSFTPVAGVAYVWETVGGVISSGQGTANVSVIWNGPQSGLLRLKNTACNTFSQKHIVIRPTPLVNIDTLNLTCTGTSAGLKVIQDYPSYNWSNGLNTQVITITNPGVYTVTVTDSKGCTASGTENATPIPSLGFTFTNINVSGPVVPYPYIYLILTAQSSPPATSYVWNDGNTAQADYVTVAGPYSVTMTDKYGCTGSATVTITSGTITGGGLPGNPPVISPCPGVTPLFTTNTPVCNPVQFTPGVTASYYLWDFGDFVYSSLSNPTHRFTTAGTHTIKLSYSNDGTNWYECTQTLTINSVMDINFTSTGTCNGATTLTNTSSSVLPVTSVLWDFGDGTTSSTTPVVSHTFPNTAPTFLVTLTLNDGVCTDMAQQQVPTDQLVANFTYADVCLNNPALFNDNTAHSNIIASYQWNFGNGQTADYYNPVTYFTTASNYTVNLTVTDANGCTSTATQSVPVNQFGTLAVTASGPLTFCKGSSVDLSLPTGYTVYWNTGDTTSTLHVTRGGVYFAYAQDNTAGCSGFSDTVTVIENIPPSAFINNQTALTQICTGAQFSLNGIPFSGVTYQWYLNGTAYTTGNNIYNYYATSSQAGNYQLVITDANGCKDTSAILNIVVNPLPAYPNITQTPSGSPCSGQPVVLSVSGSDLYQWNNGTSGTSTTVYQSGFYNVVATNSFGCASSANDYVTFNATPDFTLFPTGCYQICQSSNVTISGPAGAQTYLWSNGANTQSITLSTSGTYTLSATSSDGCSAASGTLNIDVFGSSNLNLGNDTTICAGQPLVLDAGAYPSIVWQDGSTNPTYNVVDSGLYSVTVTNSQGCTSSDTIHVNIDTITLNLGDDTTICSAIHIPLSVTGNFTSIEWQDGSTNSTYVATHSGLYKVSVTDIYGCKASDSVQINSVADSVFLGNDTALCFNATLQLQVTGTFISVVWQDGSTNDDYTVTQSDLYKVRATDASGCTMHDSIAVTYHYPSVTLGNDTTLCNINHYILTVSDTFPSAIWQTGATGDTFTVIQSGVYSVTVTDSFGCKANASVQINSVADSVNLGTDSSICNHDSLQLHVTGSFTSIIWQDGSTGATYTVTQSGLYKVLATDAAGCTVSDSLQVTVHSPTVSLGDDTTLCPNTTLLLSVNGNFARIFWQDSVVSSTYLVSTPGFYVVMVTDSFGCEAKSFVTISYYTPIQFSPQPSQRICDSTLTLSAGGIFNSYLWSNGATTESTTVTYPSQYYFTVTDQNGCSANDSVNVLTCDTNSCRNSYFIPNAFTPNGDGHNDEFALKRKPNTEPSIYFNMSIFDRLGERVFETSDEFASWDGSFKGQKAPEGVYIYVAHFVCNSGNVDVKGAVTLLR